MNRYLIISGGIFITLTMIWSCSNPGEGDQAAAPNAQLAAEGCRVMPQPFNNDVVVTAELLADEQVELRAPIAGQVLEIHFREGEKVQQGDPLIRLDDRAWKAQLGGVVAEVDAAQKEYDRRSNLLGVGGSSQEEVDAALSALESLKSQLQQLRVNIDLANVNAPFPGRLGMRNFSVGAFLQAGDLITTLTAARKLKVDFTLAQAYRSNVEIGKSIRVMVTGDTLPATIYAVDPVIDPQSRTVRVRALLQPKEGKDIMPGTFAEVMLATNQIDDALLVPSQAVVPEINEQTVYLFKKGKAVRRVIQAGTRTADKVHVLEGVGAGDTVLTTGLLQVKDGMSIQLQSVQ
ncbi:MAG: efflux RND transporter periplasmic adaptor subunit [Flavobacteriales bacterium]|nr:efflux RND transporter periplasmic adaptor subunit [Flavobacteriales bacterium]MCB9447805.1 efflux RND transporter periplasmic adaptor subunit [Flavobacteriales bacterium]